MGDKREPVWVWVALDADTRPVVAMVAGDRTEVTAASLWEALPDEYRETAIVCTDVLPAYRAVLPEGRHAAAGKTDHIERFWCTVRRRCARLVRKTLSFSKCWMNHLGALWYFIRLYNLCRAQGHYRASRICDPYSRLWAVATDTFSAADTS